MNAENIQLFTQYQKQLQEAEKAYQKKVYDLQEDVLKLNKSYQAKLTSLDKAYAEEEKIHTDQLKTIDQSFSKDSKTLTQDSIAEQSKYQDDLKALKARWTDQETVIKTAFDKKLADKAQALKDVQKQRDKVAKEIEKEYQDSKAKLERVKTVTTEIFEEARSSFQSSLSNYLTRLQKGPADDVKAYKKELVTVKKALKQLEKKQADAQKALLKNAAERSDAEKTAITDYQKSLGLMQSEAKAFITRTVKKYDSAFIKSEDDIKKTQASFRDLRKRIFNAIEAQRTEDFDLVNQYETSITNSVMQHVYSELQSIASIKNETLTHIYTHLTDWADKILKETLDIQKGTRDDLQSLIQGYGDSLQAMMQAGEHIFSQLSMFDGFDDVLEGLFLGHNIPALIDSLDALSTPLIQAQKKWHGVLLKAYKEAEEHYKELDEIQAFFDSFAEEKALAFENEQVHISRRAAQLDVEVDTAKKQYEYDSLNADQTDLFEKNKIDHLIKEYNRQEKHQIAQAKTAYAVKDLELKNVIAKAKNDFQVKKAFYAVEDASLEDKKKYRLATIEESYAVKRFDVEKKKAYAIYELKLNQNTELDQHEITVNEAHNLHQRNKEKEHAYQQELETKYTALKNAKILSSKKEIDEYELEIKRLKLEEDKEIRSLKSVFDDEISVPSNRLNEFDKAIAKRLKSINTPYQSRLKTLERFNEEIQKAKPNLEKALDVVSIKFKDDVLSTIDIYFETMKWTREYYSDLEISKIKRSDLNMKKQGQELDKHQESERKYLQNLNTYAKAAEQSVLSLFTQINQHIKKKDSTKEADLLRHLNTFTEKLQALLEEQTQLTISEIESLFNYIKEQDEAFIRDVQEGLASAKTKIGQDYATQRNALFKQIESNKFTIEDIKDASLVTPDENEALALEELKVNVRESQQALRDLDFERQRKLDRFKSEVQSLESEFDQQRENVDYQHQMAVENEENEIQSEKERIVEKRLYAEKTFDRIAEAQKLQLNHYKSVFDAAKIEASTQTQEKIKARENRLAEIERIKVRKMIDIESKLNTTLDDIQKEISSREIQLESAKEKIERQYDSLYFDYQNRAQMLNEKLNRLQKYIFTERESILGQIKESITHASSHMSQQFEKTVAYQDAHHQFKAHIDTVDTYIQNKKDAFKAAL